MPISSFAILAVPRRDMALSLPARLFRHGSAAARRAGLPPGEWYDCAGAFAAYMLGDKPRAHLARVAEHRRDAFLSRCAERFARNFRRVWWRREQRERPWPDSPAGDDPGSQVADGDAPAPETAPLWGDLTRRLSAALSQIEPSQRALLLRHYGDEEPVTAIAAALNESPNAVAQRLHRARRRLRGILERQGMDEAEACEYLSLFDRFPPPPADLKQSRTVRQKRLKITRNARHGYCVKKSVRQSPAATTQNTLHPDQRAQRASRHRRRPRPSFHPKGELSNEAFGF